MRVDLKSKMVIAAQVAMLAGMASAQPVLKTGDCPEFDP